MGLSKQRRHSDRILSLHFSCARRPSKGSGSPSVEAVKLGGCPSCAGRLWELAMVGRMRHPPATRALTRTGRSGEGTDAGKHTGRGQISHAAPCERPQVATYCVGCGRPRESLTRNPCTRPHQPLRRGYRCRQAHGPRANNPRSAFEKAGAYCSAIFLPSSMLTKNIP